jgi:hypothetical protein
MVQAGGYARFLNEAIHALLIRGDIRGENLQSDGAFQLQVPSEIDFTHATRAELRADFITA